MLTRNEMMEQLQTSICRVIFTKATGEERDMLCTLREDITPSVERKTDRVVNQETIPVWDTKAEGWRSFRIDSVVSFSYDAG